MHILTLKFSKYSTLYLFTNSENYVFYVGLKMIISALLRSMRMLVEVVILKLFCMMVFALFALQVYVGVLRQKCVQDIDSSVVVTDAYFMEHLKNDSKSNYFMFKW
jgi:hypothetical protein